MIRLTLGSLLGCSLAALAVATGGPVETVIQDDAWLLHRTDAQVVRTARTMADLGADRVRITAGWSVIERSPGTYDFAALDRAVAAVRAAGLEVMLDIAFWAPPWAVAREGAQTDRQRYEPDPARFAAFAGVVARRYAGAVALYTTWNEPNHTSFLEPQWDGDRPRSPHVYRAMHEAAYAAIKQVSPGNQVLVGGLASRGSSTPGTGHVPPLDFLRAMASEGVVHADGLALHPYSLESTPAAPSPNPGDAALGDLARVTALVDELYAAGRIDRPWPLYLTEYGYESRPPDPYVDTSLADQARLHGWATYLAHREPTVRMFAQFLLRDIDARESGFPPESPRHWRDWQSGLLFADGRPKPAAQAFKLPLHVEAHDGLLLFHGGVRPNRGAELVRIERREAAGWVPVETCGETDFLTQPDGFFTRTAPVVPGPFRLAWLRGGNVDYGVTIPVT